MLVNYCYVDLFFVLAIGPITLQRYTLLINKVHLLPVFLVKTDVNDCESVTGTH